MAAVYSGGHCAISRSVMTSIAAEWRSPTINRSSTHVVVVDTQANKVVGDIPDTPGVHGFISPFRISGRGSRATARGNNVSVVDLKTLKLIQKIETGENPDTIVYDSGRRRSTR